MIYSKACSYAIRAMVQLTLIRSDGYVRVDELLKGTDLPRQFVSKIFGELVRRDLLLSAKGRGGGFALARAPELITLYDIVATIDGDEQFDQCIVGMAECDDQQPCPLHDDFKTTRTCIKKFLQETTLKYMSRTVKRKLQLIGKEVRKSKSKSKRIGRRY